MRHVAVLALTLLLATQASAMGYYLPPAAIPEPAAIGLFVVGSAVVYWAISRRQK